MADLIEILEAQHGEIDRTLQRIEDIGRSGPTDERRDAVDRLVHALRGHSLAEREVVVPALVEVVEDGPELAADQTHSFDELDDAVSTLAGRSSDDPGHEAALGRVVELAREHVGRWSEEVIPALRDRLDTEAREDLGTGFERARDSSDDLGLT